MQGKDALGCASELNWVFMIDIPLGKRGPCQGATKTLAKDLLVESDVAQRRCEVATAGACGRRGRKIECNQF
jgi:hypothetical protein